MMLEVIFYLIIIYFVLKTVFYGIWCRKNKKRGAAPLFFLSILLLAAPWLAKWINLFL